MNSERPRTVRFGYVETIARAISHRGIDLRCWMVIVSSGSGPRAARLSTRVDLALDVPRDLLGLLLAAVDEQPARALRDVAADDQDRQSEDEAEPEADAPLQQRREDVQRGDRQQRAGGGSGPVGAVDQDVDPAAVVGRDQLVDRRVDRAVLAADAHPGDEAAGEEEQRRPGERRRNRRREVDAERDHEQPLAAEPVGQPAEQQRAEARAGHVHRRRPAGDLRGGDVDAAALGRDGAGDRADDRDLEPVEDPDRAQADQDLPVPA